MANQLDEMNGPILEQGHDINVINKRIEIKTGWGSILFEFFLWFPLIIPGLVFLFKKIAAKNYFAQLEQKIQANASQIDNYIEQRVQVLSNVASLVQKSIELDQKTMTQIAALRSGNSVSEATRGEIDAQASLLSRAINVQIENYPDLKAHGEIREAMQQNTYLQKEITACRDLYNDSVFVWNRSVNEWPTKMIVASRMKYTTRIPFAASQETKQEARKNFFA